MGRRSPPEPLWFPTLRACPPALWPPRSVHRAEVGPSRARVPGPRPPSLVPGWLSRSSPEGLGPRSDLSGSHTPGPGEEGMSQGHPGCPCLHLPGWKAGAGSGLGGGRPGTGRVLAAGCFTAPPAPAVPVLSDVWVDTLGPRKSLYSARTLPLCVPPPAGSPPRWAFPTILCSGCL